MVLECLICHRVFFANKFVRHLGSCIPKQVGAGKTVQYVLIRARSEDFGHFAYFLIPDSKTLDDLDEILRNFWLNCCYEHMSAFFIRKEELSMDLELRGFEPKSKLDYMYDFSYTTYLTIEVLKLFEFEPNPDNLSWILGHNEPFEYICDTCNKGKAVQLIPEGRGRGFFCQTCFAESVYGDDEYEEHYCLPVVNSPRMGICEYTGSKNLD